MERHGNELGRSEQLGELSPFWSRLSITTLKFGMLLQVSKDRDLAITEETLSEATCLTEFLKASLCHLFGEQLAFTKPMQDRQRTLRLVKNRPGVIRRDLLRACQKRGIGPERRKPPY